MVVACACMAFLHHIDWCSSVQMNFVCRTVFNGVSLLCYWLRHLHWSDRHQFIVVDFLCTIWPKVRQSTWIAALSFVNCIFSEYVIASCLNSCLGCMQYSFVLSSVLFLANWLDSNEQYNVEDSNRCFKSCYTEIPCIAHVPRPWLWSSAVPIRRWPAEDQFWSHSDSLAWADVGTCFCGRQPFL